MAPVEDGYPAPTPAPDGGRLARPVLHTGMGDRLPPLQPCKDARTPAEACCLPVVEGAQEKVSNEDILTRLKALQQVDESAGSGSERHWNEAERQARDCLEAYGNSSTREERLDAHSEMLIALKDAKAVAVDADGFSLLHYASMYGSVDAVASLLRNRANANSRTRVHETPLQLAAYYRHSEVCAVLLSHRARIDLADWQGRSPLAAAMASKCGNGIDNTAQAQGQCVELLRERLAVERQEGTRVKEAEDLRAQGNGFFKSGNMKEAIAAYSVGLASWDDGLIYSNRAECYLKLEKFTEAKMDAKKALGLAGEAGSRKASWRLGKACLALGELDQASEAAAEGLKQCAEDAALRQLRTDIERERRSRLGQ